MDLQARPPDAHAIASLRAITYRITSTPPKSLPPVAAQISASVWNCKDVLSSPAEASKTSSEVSTIVNRFRTTLTSLLQDRSAEGRWSAVVLTKAAIEAGGLPILSRSNGWVKFLLAILKRHSDPSTTRQLATIVLTRIFQLTWPHQELVREITTPALPAYIAAGLSNAEKDGCGSGELEAMLEAFCVLMPKHPTVFRTFEVQIRDLLREILSATLTPQRPSRSYSNVQRQAAERLTVLLHHCVPKQGSGEAWTASWTGVIEASHQTCDALFRSIVEEPLVKRSAQQSNYQLDQTLPSDPEASGLSDWSAIYRRGDRLLALLNILKLRLEVPFASSLSIGIGQLIQLISRLLYLHQDVEADPSRFNNQIVKDEREALFCVLPNIHTAALELTACLLKRFGKASMPFVDILLELTLPVFRAEKSDSNIRAAAYVATTLILETTGPSMPRPEVAELGLIIEACCNDLGAIATNNVQTTPSTSNTTPNSKQICTATLPDLHQAASTLLPAFVTKINPTTMPNKTRILIERTAIATRHKAALVACVLNPMTKATGKTGMSLLPILAKLFPGEPEVEALLRPRMPTIISQTNGPTMDDFGGEQTSVLNASQHDTDTYAFGTQGSPSPVHQTNGAALLRREEDELYSLTPPRDRDINNDVMPNADLLSQSQAPGSNGTKRPADTEYNRETETFKRTRIPSVETANLPTLSPTAKAVDSNTHETTTGFELKRDTDEAVAATHIAAPTKLADARQAAPFIEKSEADDDAGSDSSDFEMPPLTLEPDTESEDEEGEEGE